MIGPAKGALAWIGQDYKWPCPELKSTSYFIKYEKKIIEYKTKN